MNRDEAWKAFKEGRRSLKGEFDSVQEMYDAADMAGIDAILALIDPDTGFADSLVVSDGLVDEMARQLWSWCTGGSPEYWDNETDDSCTEEEGQQFTQMARHCLTAALPHAKTEAEVEEALLERLAESYDLHTEIWDAINTLWDFDDVTAEQDDKMCHQLGNIIAAAIRAQKGKSDE